MPTTPNWSLPFPSLSDPPNVPSDFEALAEAVDDAVAKFVHLEDGAALVPPSVMTTVTGYSASYGETTWADPVTGIVTLPAAGIYQIVTRTRLAPPSATYNFGNTIRTVPDTAQQAEWILNYPQAFGTAHWGCALTQHFAAGTQIYQACYGTAYTGNASISGGTFTVQLILPD